MKLFLRRNLVFAFSFTVLFFGCSKEIEQTLSKNLTLDQLEAGVAPIYNAPATGRPIKDQYIVVFKDEVSDVDQVTEALSKQGGFKPKFTYKHAIKGFAASIPAQALEGISRNPNIKYIEQDQEVKLEATQNSPTWGLDRIDQQSLPLSSSYTYNSNGSTVDAYIFDTGIRTDHTEFTGRLIPGFYDSYIATSTNDGNGHGTHVAGTVGGTIYGVAKGVRLVPVKVLGDNGSGSWSGVVAGLDWSVGHHVAGKSAVGNMSLGGGASTSVDDAVRRAINDGIVMCVAAGNETQDVIYFSPARTEVAITVGATNSSDSYASFSNFGQLVDISAPGVSITSAWKSSSTSINTISGTSMATPHVAGAAAIYLQVYPGSTPAQVQTGLKNGAVVGKISNLPSSTVNLLLQVDQSTPPTITKPSKPVLLSPINLSGNNPTSLVFSWDNSTNAQSYNLQISTSSSFSTLALNSNTLTTSISVSGFAAGTIYYWRVIANNSAGTTVSDTWSFSTLLNTPVLSSPSNGATGVSRTPTLKWNGVTNATGYDIQVSRDNTFPSVSTSSYSSSSASIKIGTALLTRTTYHWRVRAKRSTVLSDWSNLRSFTTL